MGKFVVPKKYLKDKTKLFTGKWSSRFSFPFSFSIFWRVNHREKVYKIDKGKSTLYLSAVVVGWQSSVKPAGLPGPLEEIHPLRFDCAHATEKNKKATVALPGFFGTANPAWPWLTFVARVVVVILFHFDTINFNVFLWNLNKMGGTGRLCVPTGCSSDPISYIRRPIYSSRFWPS